jgi:tetratricopeptide (TPR) repeat protein
MKKVGFLVALGISVGAVSTHAQPRNPSAQTQRGSGQSSLASALALAAATDYANAERELAAIKGADQPAAQLALARVYFEQGKFAEADKAAQAAGASQKELAAALRAQILFETGKVADAIKMLEPHKGAPGAGGRRVRLLLGEYLIESGKRQDAEDPLMKIADEYNQEVRSGKSILDAEGLAQVGRAAHLLRYPKDANTAFNESERKDKQRVETLLWRAELFLEKYDPGHAEEVTRDALKIAPNRADAKVMMARVKLDQALDFSAAEKLANEALKVNPNHTDAYAVKAGLALRDMELDAADKAINAGLAINPNHLELLSLKAAMKFLADDKAGYEQAKKDVLARNGEYSRLYSIVGEYAEWEHRYDDIVTMMKEATKLDADDAKAWAQLGVMQMRGGDETNGLTAIQTAFKKDSFNVRAYNTKRLYEEQIPNQYDLSTDGVFKIRYSKEERPILERYVPHLLAEAWGSMKARYGFVPTNPVQVELYGTREQFSVRTSGLPNIGIQGVCFGRVVASMSPKSEPFNWGNVLWHELGHVFAIQLSKNHVPRWFTEGLSEYETIARRPEWNRELDPELYSAITKGTLPAAVDMNRAFTHASDAADVTVAYYAASQMIVFTVERFGMQKVVQALKLWGDGVRTADVIQRAFGVAPKQYDEQFRAWALDRLKRYKGQYLFSIRPKPVDEAKAAAAANPKDGAAQATLVLSLLQSGKGKEAKAALEEALRLDPKNLDAHYLGAKLAEKEKNVALVEQHLQAMRAAGGDGYLVQLDLADVAEAKKDKAGMRFALEAAHRWDPSKSEPLKALYDLAKEEKRDGDALDLLRQLSKLEQHDPRIWRTLLEKLVEAKQYDEARKVGESAIYVDVLSPATHISYARALAAGGQHDRALYELDTALIAKLSAKEAGAAHSLKAQSLLALGKTAEARKERDEALKSDPQNAEAKDLKLP